MAIAAALAGAVALPTAGAGVDDAAELAGAAGGDGAEDLSVLAGHGGSEAREIGRAAAAYDWPSHFAPPVVAPDTVDRNTPFDVVATTVGLGSCWSEAGAEVTRAAQSAVITPLDYYDQDAVCLGALRELTRTIRVSFDSPGEATLWVQGRRVVNYDLGNASVTSIEKRIIVR